MSLIKIYRINNTLYWKIECALMPLLQLTITLTVFPNVKVECSISTTKMP